MQRHNVEQMINVSPYVQTLGAPVPQTVDNVMASFRLLDKPIADQVITVPQISCPSSCLSCEFLRVPQVVEQLVEVPTVLSAAVLQQQTVVQPVDVPVSRGRGRRLPGSLPGQGTAASNVEQIVDTQVPGRGNSGCVGTRSVQRTAAQIADIPVSGSCGGLHGFLSGSMQRTVAQNDDIPAHSDDFPSFLPAQGSHESRGAHHHETL